MSNPAPLTFCPLPWASFTVQPFGVALCCASTDEMREAKTQTPLQAFHGANFSAVREQFLRGQWPVQCSLCKRAEELGVESERRRAVNDPMMAPIVERHAELTSEASEILQMELSFDNLCNLKCRMCSPRYSSRWSEDIEPLKNDFDLFPRLADVIEPVEHLGFADLLPSLGALKMIHLKGGEPFLNRRLFAFLDDLSRSSVASEIELSIITNGTVYREEQIAIMKRFKFVSLNISVDGVDPWQRYIRHGRFSCDDVLQNALRFKNAEIKFRITTAFQIYNMLSYGKLIEKFSTCTDVFETNFVYTYGLNAQIVPDSLRQLSIARLKEVEAATENEITLASLRSAIATLEAGEFDHYQWGKFKEMTAKLDAVRSESLAAVDSELASWVL